MDRRSFLRRTSLALAGGLIVGDAAMSWWERLTHRKVFALGKMPRTFDVRDGLWFVKAQNHGRAWECDYIRLNSGRLVSIPPEPAVYALGHDEARYLGRSYHLESTGETYRGITVPRGTYVQFN